MHPAPCSERFVVGGHEWVLLFYPDGKRSSSEMHNIQPAQVPPHNAHLQQAAGGNGGAALAGMPPPPAGGGGAAPQVGIGVGPLPPRAPGAAAPAAPAAGAPGQPPPAALRGPPGAPGQPPVPVPGAGAALMVNPAAAQLAVANQQQAAGNNDYCALFVALIGETDSPQGVVNTSEGRVVRAFHRFTLVDQSGACRTPRPQSCITPRGLAARPARGLLPPYAAALAHVCPQARVAAASVTLQ